MAQTIQIKKSHSSNAPSANLAHGELAYGHTSANGGKLFIGRPGTTSGGEANDIIGGKYYTDVIDARTANSQAAVATTNTSGRTYKVQKDSNDHSVVNVPWANDVYTLPLASSSTRGGVKIGYTESGNNYPVELSSEKMYVNVPWTDASGNNKLPLAGGTLTGDISFGDNVRIKMGAQTGGDLNIYHDGSDSIIEDRGDGNLKIKADFFEFVDSSNNKMFGTDSSADVTLFVAGSDPAFKTSNASVDVIGRALKVNDINEYTSGHGVEIDGFTIKDGEFSLADDKKASFGTHGDLKIFHGTDDVNGVNIEASYIKEDGTGNLILQGSNIEVRSSTDELYAQFVQDGVVQLSCDNDVKLSTTASGINVIGEVKGDSLDIDGNADISGSLTLGGDLNVTGNINQQNVNVTDLDVTDKTITVGAGQTAAASSDSGIIVDGANAKIIYEYNTASATGKFEIDQGTGTQAALLTAANWGSEYTGAVDGGSF